MKSTKWFVEYYPAKWFEVHKLTPIVAPPDVSPEHQEAYVKMVKKKVKLYKKEWAKKLETEDLHYEFGDIVKISECYCAIVPGEMLEQVLRRWCDMFYRNEKSVTDY